MSTATSIPAFKLRIFAAYRVHQRNDVSAKCAPSLQATRLEPVTAEASAWAPATIANMGPGFDWMGCAVNVCPEAVAPASYCMPSFKKVDGQIVIVQ
jgi:hypothetical protein